MQRHEDAILAGVLRRLIENNRDDHGAAYVDDDEDGSGDLVLEGREPLSVAEQRLIRPLCEPVEGAEGREVARVARVLMAAWEKAEGRPVSVSYVATFADLARAVLADQSVPPAGVGLRVGLGE